MSKALTAASIAVHVVGAALALRALALSSDYGHALRLLLPRSWPLTLAGSLVALLLCVVAAWKTFRRRSAPALGWRALLYVGVGAWAVEVFVWNKAHPLLDAWTVTAAAGLHAAFCLLAPRLEAGRLRWLRLADVVSMNVVLFLLLGEAGLRALAAAWSSPLFLAPGSFALDRIAAHHLVPGKTRFGFPHNSWGYFDHEFLPRAQRTRTTVLCIGDSFSAGTVPHARHYTTVAEGALGDIDLYNLGVPACGPQEYLYLWQHEGKSLQPDFLVVALFLGNDVTDASSGVKALDWRDPESSMLFRVGRRLWLMFKGTRGTRTGDEASEPGDAAAGSASQEPAWLDDPSQEVPTFSAEEFLRIETARARSVCRSGPDSRFDHFFGLLQSLVESAGSTPLAFVLIPDEFQVEDPLWETVTRRIPVPLERDRPQSQVLSWCAARGVPCLDLLPALRALPIDADGWRHAYLRQDTHFNARGNRCAGQELAAFLRPRLEGLK